MKAKNPQRWFIYRMRCLVDGVGDYIGMTHNPFQREKEHRGKRKGTKLTAAIHLYGERNFVYEILDECETEEQARALEKRYIQKLGTGWPRGLNTMHAGDGVRADQHDKRRAAQIKAWDSEEKRRRHSERLKRAMNTATAKERNSEAAKRRWADPEYRAKHVAAATGFKHTEETKQKLREQKLAASAAKGGAKGKVRKYPGLTASEISQINAAREDVQKKRSATWEKNRKHNEAAARVSAAHMNSDPAIREKRIAAIRLRAAQKKLLLSPQGSA